MNALKTKFSGRTTIFFLAMNWITMIVLTVYFLGEENKLSYKIVGTLLIGFVLQLGFLTNQLKKKLK